MSDRRMKPGRIEVERCIDGSYLLTAYAPRDGAGRPLTYDLKYPMTKEQFRKHVADLEWMRAGE